MFIYVICLLFLYVICDFNYFLRTLFTVLSGRLYKRNINLSDSSTIYGICTFQDCDLTFTHLRLARLVRDLDFARYYFYDQTGIYKRSQSLNIKSLQGCTFTLSLENIPLFVPYQIITKLVYWDDRSLFFEHKVETLFDGKTRALLISRQHAVGKTKDSTRTTEQLLKDLPGFKTSPECPENIRLWIESMAVNSKKIRSK